MVFLAITPQGLKEAVHLAQPNNSPIWCGADAISESEFTALHGVNLTRFDYSLCGETQEVILEALDTIAEHHPNERVWVENTVQP